MKTPHHGVCNICGTEGPLTAEHVPPKAAFNNKRVIRMKFEDAIHLGPEETAKGTYEQGGAKAYTLCGRCNNNTGRWYAKQFVEWCYQGADILNKTEGRPSLIYMYHAFPLRIIKQIVTMFLAINGNGFAEKHSELVDFVLSKERKYLPPAYQFYVYYNLHGRLRYSTLSARLDINTGVINAFTEITFPPFGYVMSVNSPPPDERLFNITHFVRYGYSEYEYIKVYPPVLPTHMPMPGDYRSIGKIQQDVQTGEEFLGNNTVLAARDDATTIDM